ncbi:BCNT-domain-containing protein [Lichtheimia hyalospora FSU 10163]|nr:BCNT-domain-containing protein [Lichtheimia hyalospora FSU 10163]
MDPVVQYDENDNKTTNNEQPINHWAEQDDSDNDSDYTPDVQDGTDAESDDDYSSQSPKTPVEITTVIPKRKASDVEQADSFDDAAALKKTKIDMTDLDAEAKRKARVNAIWAEMNQKQEPKSRASVQDTTKQPLDDISATLNDNKDEKASSTLDKSKNASTIMTGKIATTNAKCTNNTRTTTRRPGIVRPKSTLSALVSQYNIKVPKMNTLEKSRLDWNGYVEKEGIRDELKYKNKDGYMEKVAFLQRVDDRRLSHLKAGQKASKR